MKNYLTGIGEYLKEDYISFKTQKLDKKSNHDSSPDVNYKIQKLII